MLGNIINFGLLFLSGWFLDALSSTKLQLLISLLLNYCNMLHHLGEQDLILCIINKSHALQLKALSWFSKSTYAPHSLVSISHACKRFRNAQDHSHLLAAEIIASHQVRIWCHQERIASWSKLHVQTPEFLKFHLLNKNVLNSFCRQFSNHIVLTEQKNRVRKNLRSE